MRYSELLERTFGMKMNGFKIDQIKDGHIFDITIHHYPIPSEERIKEILEPISDRIFHFKMYPIDSNPRFRVPIYDKVRFRVSFYEVNLNIPAIRNLVKKMCLKMCNSTKSCLKSEMCFFEWINEWVDIFRDYEELGLIQNINENKICYSLKEDLK